MQVLENYPVGCAKGADYLTGAALGDVIEDRGDHKEVRPERVLWTGVDIDYEGVLCLGERTVRHMAAMLDMVDKWRVDALKTEFLRTRDERDALSGQVLQLRTQIDRLRDLERAEPEKVYVAADGSQHASMHAASSVGQRAGGRLPGVFGRARPLALDDAPLPDGAAPEVHA